MYKYKILEMEVKDVDRKEGIVSGYFSAFNVKDSDGDIIRPGAFKQSIQEWGPEGKGRVKHLLNHDPGKPLGKILELKEDDYGLFYRSQIGIHDLGRDFVKMVESDLIKEHSIGFNTLKSQKNEKEAAIDLLHLKLFEGSSLTAWGANEYTPLLEMKSGNLETLKDRMNKFEKFVRNTDASDDTIELCLLQIKQLSQIIETMSSGLLAVKAEDLPKESKDAVDDNQIHSLQNIFSQWKTLNK
jgi:HK97 family phage prohead protease